MWSLLAHALVLAALLVAWPRARCAAVGAWLSARRRIWVTGCSLSAVSVRDPAIDVLRCQRCGTCDVGWRGEAPPRGWGDA